MFKKQLALLYYSTSLLLGAGSSQTDVIETTDASSIEEQCRSIQVEKSVVSKGDREYREVDSSTSSMISFGESGRTLEEVCSD